MNVLPFILQLISMEMPTLSVDGWGSAVEMCEVG